MTEIRLTTTRMELRPVPAAAAAALPDDRELAARLLNATLPAEWPQPDLLDVLPLQAKARPQTECFGVWVMIEHDSRSVVGDIGFIGPPDETGSVEVGYSVIPRRRRRGYASEAARAILDWAVSQAGVHIVVASCERDNTPSIRTLERLGFRRTSEANGRIRWQFETRDRSLTANLSGPFADIELEACVTAQSPAGEMDVTAIREAVRMRAQLRPRGPEMHGLRELEIGALRGRLYRPTDAPGPIVVYFHGGGWTVGSLDSHDRWCRRLAAGSGVAVLAIDYRLAPEHRWPAAVDDAVSALEWVARGARTLRVDGPVAAAGDSAGGTLVALACLRLRDTDPRALPDLQVLLYANTDLTGQQPSMREKALGWGLDADTVRFFNSQWVPDERHWSSPDVSPLHAPDLRGLPPALVVTAEHDVLRDEGEAYAGRLREAGVGVILRREPGLVHNFALLDDISPACIAAGERIALDVRRQVIGDAAPDEIYARRRAGAQTGAEQ